MSEASVVIGSGFGDEGKGLITDFETRRLSAKMVTRFNGGGQAGHTVVTKSGLRHVFSHVSAGTFAGASTYLSSKFIFNPITFLQEVETLQIKPQVFANRDCKVSTIYDMVVNSLAEISRTSRHGSCGMGINETVTRHEYFPLTTLDVCSKSIPELALMLKNICEQWVPSRIKALNITKIEEPYFSILNNKDFESIAAKMQISCNSHIMLYDKSKKESNVVFEGAQGLMLDEELGVFPHVTRSLTGLPYALIAAKEQDIESVKPIYVTRAYTTRHGAGPLEGEGISFGGNPVDVTNKPNPWQGTLRFAPLNVDNFVKFVEQDIKRGKQQAISLGISVESPTIAVTCLDQITENKVSVLENEKIKSLDVEYLPDYLVSKFDKQLNVKLSHVSFGPTANNVTYLI